MSKDYNAPEKNNKTGSMLEIVGIILLWVGVIVGFVSIYLLENFVPLIVTCRVGRPQVCLTR